MLKKILILATLLSLIGCASMNSKFDCPMGRGVMCRSISDVNAMVDGGTISTAYSKENNNNKRSTPGNSNTVSPLVSTTVNHGTYGEPAKQSDTVLRVWVAPYQDQDGNYNQQNFVYATVKKGQWVINDAAPQPANNSLKNAEKNQDATKSGNDHLF